MAPRCNFIGFTVADVPASLAFYRRVGLDIPAGADHEPHVEHELPNGMKLAWDSIENVRSFLPSWQAPTGSGRINLAFQCDNPAEVDKIHAELTSAGYRSALDPFDAFWGQRYATVLDPDGNGVDLYAPQG